MFEFDYAPGSDVISEIIAGPKAARGMETELFGRLALFEDRPGG